MQPITVEQYKGHTIKIFSDDSPDSPREWDNLGTMICLTRHYTLGDKHDFSDAEELQTHLKETKAVALPLFLYDHSGLTISTRPFSCQWDSGQIGFIFITPEKIKTEKLTKKQALKILEAEVKIFDQYLRGDIYGFVIEKENICKTCKHNEPEQVESIWGFYGLDEVTAEAKSIVDSLTK